MDDDSEHKKAKGAKRFVTKRRLTFRNYKDCLFNNKNILKSQQRFNKHCHDVCTQHINKIALTSNNDDKITTYLQGTKAVKVCKSEF